LALNSVTAPVAKRLFGNAGTLWSKTFTLNPTKVILEVPTTEQLASEKVATFPDNLVYNSNGTELGTVKDLVATLLRADFTLREFGKRGDSTHKYFVLEWTPPRDEEHCLCLKKLDPDILRPIELVRVTGECNFDISEFRLNHGDLGGVTIAWGTGAFLGKKALLVASEVEGAGVALSITTDDK